MVGNSVLLHSKHESCARCDVTVKFYTTHNHLGHLPISRMLIARQLQEGVAIEKIFDNIRDNVKGSCTRLHISSTGKTFSDNLILRVFKSTKMTHMQSVYIYAWVVKLQGLEYDPVTIFNPRAKNVLPTHL